MHHVHNFDIAISKQHQFLRTELNTTTAQSLQYNSS